MLYMNKELQPAGTVRCFWKICAADADVMWHFVQQCKIKNALIISGKKQNQMSVNDTHFTPNVL